MKVARSWRRRPQMALEGAGHPGRFERHLAATQLTVADFPVPPATHHPAAGPPTARWLFLSNFLLFFVRDDRNHVIFDDELVSRLETFC